MTWGKRSSWPERLIAAAVLATGLYRIERADDSAAFRLNTLTGSLELCKLGACFAMGGD